MGPRYTAYRVWHEVEKRTGLLKKKHPTEQDKFFLSLSEWRKKDFQFLIGDRENIKMTPDPNPELQEKARKILDGQMCFFSHDWRHLGTDYDWITNPVTGYKYDVRKHWTEINDFSAENGDIKDVWEKSRFTFLLTIIRYDFHFGKDSAEFVFSEIEDWIDKNPVNRGPNWKCSQEISLRLFNWSYALAFYQNSSALTEERWRKIQNTIYWSLHHVYHHINFSRIAVRNNHAITETLCLALSHMLFPFIPETKKWSAAGRKWFEKEIAYQIYEDGTFLQFSMNYHRVVIQLLSLGIAVSEKSNQPFSEVIYDRAYKSLDFLYQCVQEENGYVPNYGNNDGAWFFPLSETHYRDYRPQLNTLHKILTGENLYSSPQLTEDSKWFATAAGETQFKSLKKAYGPLSFPEGGFYILREKYCFTFIRCGNHKDRPAQADNLHLDIWKNGENILRDSGTYKYNTSKDLQEYFTGTASHNTVRIGSHSQMLKGSRFIWYYWTQAKYAGWEELEDRFIFKGGIKAYQYLDPELVHHRQVTKYKDKDEWEITDGIEGKIKETCFQQWHIEPNTEIEFTNKNINLTPTEIKSYNSSFYGEKEKGKGIAFPFKKNLTTTIKI